MISKYKKVLGQLTFYKGTSHTGNILASYIIIAEVLNIVVNMASSSRAQVLSLYRMLIKESKKFPSYNYR